MSVKARKLLEQFLETVGFGFFLDLVLDQDFVSGTRAENKARFFFFKGNPKSLSQPCLAQSCETARTQHADSTERMREPTSSLLCGFWVER